MNAGVTEGDPLSTEVEKVAAMLMTARRLLAGGTMVDLSALQGMVNGVCLQVAALPREQGRALLPGLESLRRGLDYLGDDLGVLHARISGGGNAAASPGP